MDSGSATPPPGRDAGQSQPAPVTSQPAPVPAFNPASAQPGLPVPPQQFCTGQPQLNQQQQLQSPVLYQQHPMMQAQVVQQPQPQGMLMQQPNFQYPMQPQAMQPWASQGQVLPSPPQIYPPALVTPFAQPWHFRTTDSTVQGRGSGVGRSLWRPAEDVCAVCSEKISEIKMFSPCNHLPFCKNCVRRVASTRNGAIHCPTCNLNQTRLISVVRMSPSP